MNFELMTDDHFDCDYEYEYNYNYDINFIFDFCFQQWNLVQLTQNYLKLLVHMIREGMF